MDKQALRSEIMALNEEVLLLEASKARLSKLLGAFGMGSGVQCGHKSFFATFNKDAITFVSRSCDSYPWKAKIRISETEVFTLLDAEALDELVDAGHYTREELRGLLPRPKPNLPDWYTEEREGEPQ